MTHKPNIAGFSTTTIALTAAAIAALLLFPILPSNADETTSASTSTASAPQWIDFTPTPDLSGWVRRGGKAEYRVENGVLIGSTIPGTPNTFLCTEKDYADFILELDFKTDPKLNSGIQIRSESKPDYKNGVVHGYQIEIDPREDRAWSAGIYDESRRGWLCNLENNPDARAAFKQGEWNHVTIVAVGDTIKTWINGVPAAHLRDSMTPTGFIGLQVHSNSSATPLEVSWRNLRLLPLDQPNLPATTPPPPAEN